MNDNFYDVVKAVFEPQFQKLGLSVHFEYSDLSQTVNLKFDLFSVVLQKYHHEIYCTICEKLDSENGLNLFNLIEYFSKESNYYLKSNYFKHERDLSERYRKQIFYIATALFENLRSINDFFEIRYFERNLNDFEKYWKAAHPELYN